MMGCSSSSAAGAPAEATAFSSEESTSEDEAGILQVAMAKAAEANETVANQRTGFGRFMQEFRDGPAEQQLLYATAAMSVLSSQAEAFQGWVECKENMGSDHASAIICSLGHSNINFSTTMLRLLFSLTEEVANYKAPGSSTSTGTSVPQPSSSPPGTVVHLDKHLQDRLAAALPEQQLENVLRFTHAWGLMMSVSAVETVAHPALGAIAFVQPLLSSCILFRALRAPGEDSLEIFTYLLDRGADPNLPNSLGLTPLMLATLRLAALKADEATDTQAVVDTLVTMIRKLLEAGADPEVALPRWKARHPSSKGIIQGSSILWMLMAVVEHINSRLGPGQHLTASTLLHYTSSSALEADPISGHHTGLTHVDVAWEGREAAHQQVAVLLREGAVQGAPRLRNSWALRATPFQHSIWNVLWLVSQVMIGTSMTERRRILSAAACSAPFTVPALTLISATRLQQLGHIPRCSLTASAAVGAGAVDGGYRPTVSEDLPQDAHVVFISHRWLGWGHPDNKNGDKWALVVEGAKQLAAARGLPLDRVWLWLDYAVVDQENPMPGIQILPAYMACCDDFLHLWNPEYWERAWCLTEQFMRYRLLSLPALAQGNITPTGPGSHLWCLQPPQSSISASGGQDSAVPAPAAEWRLEAQRFDQPPPNPALGKLAVESERVALATLTAAMGLSAGGRDKFDQAWGGGGG